MSIENIQDSRSLVPFNKEGSQTAVDLTKEAQAAHALSMQVFQEMQAVNTELQKQNTCLKVALIDSKARENAIKMLHEAKVRSLEEANESLEKSVTEMRDKMTASIRITDERIKQVIAEKIEALKAVERIYEERIKEMQKVLELKLQSTAMYVESKATEAFAAQQRLKVTYDSYSREAKRSSGGYAAQACSGVYHIHALELKYIASKLRH